MKLEDADPWLGDRVRLPDGREGKVRGTSFQGDRTPTDTVHVQLDDGSWVDDVPEDDAIVIVLNEDVPLEWRHGRGQRHK